MKRQQSFLRKVAGTRAVALYAVAATMTFCATFFSADAAMAAEIKLLASANAAIRSALVELAPQFERSTGHRITMDFATALPLKRRIDAGEKFDIVIAPAFVDDFIKDGKVVADTRAPLARTGLGISASKGVPKPDISSVDALKRTLLNAKSVGYEPESQPGLLFLEILDRLGIAQEVRPRLRTVESGAAALERREAEIVVSSITNLAAVADSVVAFPPEIQRYIDFAIAASATTKEPEAARALVRFLMSPPAVSVFKSKGFQRD